MSTKNSANHEQRISGFYKLVTFPWFYESFQNLLGAQQARKCFFGEWVQTQDNSNVLELGCGPTSSLAFIRYHSYHGIDINPQHIAQHQSKISPTVHFETGAAQDVVPHLSKTFDVVLALGFLHHLNDKSVTDLLDAAIEKLRQNGSIFFLEPVYLEKQNRIAKLLKDLDSGKHVRTLDGYCKLMQREGFRFDYRITHDSLRVPYDHFWGRLTRN